MSVLAAFGVGAAAEAALTDQTLTGYKPPVTGRIAAIDADFLAYQVSAESKAELDPLDPTPRRTLNQMKAGVVNAGIHIMHLARAETGVMHVTYNSNKGGRAAQAIIKPYQASRYDKEEPRHLEALRSWMASDQIDDTRLTCVNHTTQEADDGMATQQFHDPDNVIVCSADKDLYMVPGWSLDMNTKEIKNDKDKFGEIWVKDMVSPTTGKVYKRKVVGTGTKFFWAQLLMGDSADNISGLPECPGATWQYYSGSKAYADTMKQWIAATDEDVIKKLDDKLEKLCAKPKKCGDVLTFSILKDCRTDRECYNRVKEAYQRLQDDHGYQFKHWDTQKPVEPTVALYSEMQLLWMRRSNSEHDVLSWLKESLK